MTEGGAYVYKKREVIGLQLKECTLTLFVDGRRFQLFLTFIILSPPLTQFSLFSCQSTILPVMTKLLKCTLMFLLYSVIFCVQFHRLSVRSQSTRNPRLRPPWPWYGKCPCSLMVWSQPTRSGTGLRWRLWVIASTITRTRFLTVRCRAQRSPVWSRVPTMCFRWVTFQKASRVCQESHVFLWLTSKC